MSIKACLWIFIVFIVSGGMLTGRIPLSSRLYFVSCIYASVGLLWSFYGEMRDTPGALHVITVMVLYPLFFPLCAALFRAEDTLYLYKLFFVCAWIIVVIDVVYVLGSWTYLGGLLHTIFGYIYANAISTVVIDNSNAIKFNLMNIVSIIFLLPFFISALLFPRSRRSALVLTPLVLLLLAVAILSGRRALLLTMVLGPAIAFIVTYRRHPRLEKRKGSRRWWIPLAVILVALLWLYVAANLVGIRYYEGVISSIFDFTENQSNLIRVYQYRSLIDGIFNAPFLGHGAGAAASYISSYKWPWMYELYYIAFIFQYGIVGFFIYALGIAYLCWQLICSVRQNGRASFEYYLLSGFIAFMIANATNPYLSTFDYMWIIFIPYAIANRQLFRSRRILLGPSSRP